MSVDNKLIVMHDELKSFIQRTDGRYGSLQKQVDNIDASLADRHTSGAPSFSLEAKLRDSDNIARLIRDGKGSAVITLPASAIERKTTITSSAAGAQTTGVLQIDRTTGIVAEARQALTVRGVLSARPTTNQIIDFVRVNAAMVNASPQVEASAKLENAVTFNSVSEKVRTLATWIPATRQILDDFSELAGFINTSLAYRVDLAEELELLSGDGTGEHLNGLMTQAASFDTSLLSASNGYNKLDIVGRAVQQVTASKETAPTFIVVNPNDWWDIRLTKDGFGKYILGDPQTNVAPSLFGLRVVSTVSIPEGEFLVGSGDAGSAEIRDRMEMQVEVSTEHASYFTQNMVAVRAEKRLALIVKRPNSFVTGTFASSPA